jgi:4-diphosphocytidyl-2-C-methyl-D-erythritol kinase
MEFTAPAKINLYLEVLKKREDGFHQIETLFERISIKDKLSIEEVSGETVVECQDPGVPTGEDSLLFRAIKLFTGKSQSTSNFRVRVEKNIPIGAGLGGGSSDAATVLMALNEISGFPLEKEDLLEMARKLGSDVPFFIENASFAIGTERGDVIRSLESEAKLWHVIINPPFELKTSSVYEKVPALGLTKPGGVDRMFSAFLKDNNTNKIAENLHNDLQTIVLRDFPSLGKVFTHLEEEGAQGVLLSGSGPTVFGLFTEEKAPQAAENLRKIFTERDAWRIYIAHTC